ncbi:urease subunit beta [Paraglaciecola hydrolytica]|uniref:Urease subunit beta n=1 Tax=Paraglaciecola hydrolytica TaxID=1799789 RepID=A0A136A4N7_9ALTE|nr:urease subunit beta [Paraglaciecola hydrolytica]KXI30205.1 urease subunit beta [Paraglaciecola hydrolytica]
MIPGEIFPAAGDIVFNVGANTQSVQVINSGDRPIQVGSHYHFYEVNPALQFERDATLGWRLNITAGTAVRFEPGQARTVELVELGGSRSIFGFRGEVMRQLDAAKKENN